MIGSAAAMSTTKCSASRRPRGRGGRRVLGHGPNLSPRSDGLAPAEWAGHDRRAARDHLSARAAGQPAARRHRRRDPRPPGGRAGRRDRLRQDHPAAEDLPRARPRHGQDDRPHPAAPDRGPVGGRADRRRARHRARRPGRLPGAVHRPDVEAQPGQADDRRHPARRAAARPRPAPLRHDHHRRGARAVAQHRLPARLPQAAAAAAARPQGHHHQRDDRRGAVRRALRRAGGRGVGAHVPGRGALPTAGRAAGGR